PSSVAEREAPGLTGPDGAGRSILFAAAAGVERLGQVGVRSLRSASPPPLLISQFPERMFFEEVVRSEVTYSAVARGALKREALADAERCFSLLNLGGASLLERRVWELSG